MALHRERLASAKQMMPTGLKHAATTRLFKTMRPKGSMDELETSEEGSAANSSSDRSKLSSPAPKRHSSSRRKVKRTKSVPVIPSWEMRIPSDLSSSSLLLPAFDPIRQSESMAGPSDAGSAEADAEAQVLVARLSDADNGASSSRSSSSKDSGGMKLVSRALYLVLSFSHLF